MSVTIDTKALRYIAEGRLNVLQASSDHVMVEVRGSDSDPYIVRFIGEWHCSCPARVAECSHMVAAQLVVHRTIEFPKLYDGPEDLDAFIASIQ